MRTGDLDQRGGGIGDATLRGLARSLTDDDHRLERPPAGIWDAIEDLVAPDGSMATAGIDPRTPPWRDEAGFAVEYRIDEFDRLVGVGGGWAAFARENFAPELAAPSDRPLLWEQIDHDGIRELWKSVVDRVRAARRAARLTFRCDAPAARRWFEMTITPQDDGVVRFRSVMLFEEARPPVSLLDPDTARDERAAPIEVCNWCGRARADSAWIDIEVLVRDRRMLEDEALPTVVNGICDDCRQEMSVDTLIGDAAGA